MNHLRKALLTVVLLTFTTTGFADFENIGQGGVGDVGVDGNIEEGRFLGLLKKGKGHETHTNFVPYPYPVPVIVPVYQNQGHGGKLGLLGKGLDQGFGFAGEGFNEGYYQGFPNQYPNFNPLGYGGFGPGLGSGYGFY
ncbi:uncharacterized protein LOC129943110 [Eupeodes corollae]|uniref:uncharacterized protein LOC129943110 n=1 Tax=Eupeodes corollae TaxID=290404 RepID=UPI0024938446|nr:uncharacterized protein LOC129943110 [Eupeodes corollae]